MSLVSMLRWVAGGLCLLLLACLFQLYQNPLLQIYLSGWVLC